MSLRQKILDKLFNFYPPYLGAGVKLVKASDDNRYCKVEMPLKLYNRNYVGTHFGGSLYSMVDPWYMLMLMKNLGRNYIVWDKAATIRFKKPGKSKVHAEFKLSQEDIDEIKKTLETHSKMDKIFHVEIRDTHNNLIAEVDKTIYIKKK
jgi:hypothetical protein